MAAKKVSQLVKVIRRNGNYAVVALSPGYGAFTLLGNPRTTGAQFYNEMACETEFARHTGIALKEDGEKVFKLTFTPQRRKAGAR